MRLTYTRNKEMRETIKLNKLGEMTDDGKKAFVSVLTVF